MVSSRRPTTCTRTASRGRKGSNGACAPRGLCDVIDEFIGRVKEACHAEMSPAKFEALYRTDSPHRPVLIKRGGVMANGMFEPGMTVNGVPVGTTGFVTAILGEKVDALVSDNKKIVTLLQDADPQALWSLVRLCRHPQALHWLRHLPPSATSQPFQPLQTSLDEMVTAAAGSSEWRTDPITSRRMASGVGFGGGGLIRLQDLAPLAFLGGLFSVAKLLVDHIGEAGVVIKGWADPVYGQLFGAGAFDAAHKGVGSYTTFLQVQDAAGVRWGRAQAMVDEWTELRNGMTPAARAGTPFARPVQDSGHELGKEQRALTQA